MSGIVARPDVADRAVVGTRDATSVAAAEVGDEFRSRRAGSAFSGTWASDELNLGCGAAWPRFGAGNVLHRGSELRAQAHSSQGQRPVGVVLHQRDLVAAEGKDLMPIDRQGRIRTRIHHD